MSPFAQIVLKVSAILEIFNIFLRLHEVKRQRYIFSLTQGIHALRPNGQNGFCPIPLSCGIALELEQN